MLIWSSLIIVFNICLCCVVEFCVIAYSEKSIGMIACIFRLYLTFIYRRSIAPELGDYRLTTFRISPSIWVHQRREMEEKTFQPTRWVSISTTSMYITIIFDWKCHQTYALTSFNLTMYTFENRYRWANVTTTRFSNFADYISEDIKRCAHYPFWA